MNQENKIAIFQESPIRKTWNDEEWWFVIVDVIKALSDSKNPSGYLKDMRKRDAELSKAWKNIAHQLPVDTEGGTQKMNCANTEGTFRIIQSIPSPKAEPFKLWLAKVGYERIQEIENPELAAQRARALFQEKGYPNAWIDTRMQSIETRQKLTEEWDKRGVKKGIEYAILTAEISEATFGMKPSEYKKFKNLKKENLRDHMTELELIFTMLGEAGTRDQAKEDDAQGFEENKQAAVKGGTSAGKALDAFEQQSGKEITTSDNFLKQIEEAKKGTIGQEKLNLEVPDEEE